MTWLSDWETARRCLSCQFVTVGLTALQVTGRQSGRSELCQGDTSSRSRLLQILTPLDFPTIQIKLKPDLIKKKKKRWDGAHLALAVDIITV